MEDATASAVQFATGAKAWQEAVRDQRQRPLAIVTDPENAIPQPDEPASAAPSLRLRRALRYRVLALLWCLVTPAAVFLLVRDRAWLTASGLAAKLVSVRFEQWIALLLIAAHFWFGWQAWRSRGVRGDV